MQPSIMITNGGTHPADKQAAMTAKRIMDLIQIDENSNSPEATAARKAKPRLELDLADKLEELHEYSRTYEVKKLEEKGDARLAKAIDVTGMPEKAWDAVSALFANSPFAEHFKQPHVQEVVKYIVEGRMESAADDERSWHADRNPDGPHAKRYREAKIARQGDAMAALQAQPAVAGPTA
jgi:hypothetical protein